jgi:hypothetical protein
MSHDRTKSLSREYQGSIYFNSYYFVSNFTICNKYDVSHEVDLLNSLLGCLFQNYVMMMIKLSLVGQFSPSFDNDLFLVFFLCPNPTRELFIQGGTFYVDLAIIYFAILQI